MTTPVQNPGYVRHRPRYVAQSVYDDLKRTLTATGWMGDVPGRILAVPKGLIKNNPIVVMDAFPDLAQGEDTKLNTFAMDKGIQGDLEEWQLGGGSPSHSQDYAFTMAFYANSDATAQALMSDLADRYNGLTDSPFVTLYNSASATPIEVVRMEVESFAFTKATDTQGIHENNLHFARLVITDYLDESVRVLS